MTNWGWERLLIVFGGTALIVGVKCMSAAGGWHGWGTPYYTTPFGECLTQSFPIFYVLVALVLIWFTRSR